MREQPEAVGSSEERAIQGSCKEDIGRQTTNRRSDQQAEKRE